MPSQATHSGKFLTTDGSVASWATLTGGDVVGPSSSTDNAIARFDLATGKLLQNSVVTVDDSGSINIPTGQSYKINGTALTAANVGAAATSHAHGNVTTDGKIGTTATIPIITGTGGVLQAGSFGTGAGTFCQGNDSRLSDARTPTAHTHGNITNTGYLGTTASIPLITGTAGIIQAGSFGTGAGTFCQGNDARLSDARTPTAHVLNSASHTVSGLTAGHFLMATGATTFAFQAHTSHSTLTISAPLSGTSYNGSAAVSIGLATAYGDTKNPYGSKTAKYFLAAPNAAAGVPSFRAIVASDIPTLNQSTTGSAGSVAQAVTFNNGGAGAASGTTYNGATARTISYNTIGAAASSHTHTLATIDAALHASSKIGAPTTPEDSPATVFGSTYPMTTPYTYHSLSLTAGVWLVTLTICVLGYRSQLGILDAWISTGTAAAGAHLAEATASSSDYPSSCYIAVTCTLIVTVTSTTTYYGYWQAARGEFNTTASGRCSMAAVQLGV